MIGGAGIAAKRSRKKTFATQPYPEVAPVSAAWNGDRNAPALQGPGDLAELARQPAQPIAPVTGERVSRSLLGAVQHARERGSEPVAGEAVYVIL